MTFLLETTKGVKAPKDDNGKNDILYATHGEKFKVSLRENPRLHVQKG